MAIDGARFDAIAKAFGTPAAAAACWAASLVPCWAGSASRPGTTPPRPSGARTGAGGAGRRARPRRRRRTAAVGATGWRRSSSRPASKRAGSAAPAAHATVSGCRGSRRRPASRPAGNATATSTSLRAARPVRADGGHLLPGREHVCQRLLRGVLPGRRGVVLRARGTNRMLRGGHLLRLRDGPMPAVRRRAATGAPPTPAALTRRPAAAATRRRAPASAPRRPRVPARASSRSAWTSATRRWAAPRATPALTPSAAASRCAPRCAGRTSAGRASARGGRPPPRDGTAAPATAPRPAWPAPRPRRRATSAVQQSRGSSGWPASGPAGSAAATSTGSASRAIRASRAMSPAARRGSSATSATGLCCPADGGGACPGPDGGTKCCASGELCDFATGSCRGCAAGDELCYGPGGVPEGFECCAPGTFCDFGTGDCLPPAVCGPDTRCVGEPCDRNCNCVSSVEGTGACVDHQPVNCGDPPCDTSADCGDGGLCVDVSGDLCCGGRPRASASRRRWSAEPAPRGRVSAATELRAGRRRASAGRPRPGSRRPSAATAPSGGHDTAAGGHHAV